MNVTFAYDMKNASYLPMAPLKPLESKSNDHKIINLNSR